MKGIVFDFDGLMIDTESVWFDAFRDTLNELHDVEIELERYSSCIGTDDAPLFSYYTELVGEEIDSELITEMVEKRYHERMSDPQLREGVMDYLEAAKKQGLKIGLASSSSRKWVLSYLEKCNVKGYFEVIKGKEDVEKVKPDPALYREAVKELGLMPQEVVAFEDSLNGSKAAIEAGLFCVIVPNPVTSHLPFEGYHGRLATMKEKGLIEVLESVQKAHVLD
ncbi:HAD family hydrolase [Rossellomorea aquimaris]|uniref:HAD family hydrolase n=1 Tax=Rossellomorea aquimaris TaxID=189382 RepID=UPI0007D0A5F9|nr:HAD family hydrolase [Rossellomorea aquimaris]